jgi:hypothetical protein
MASLRVYWITLVVLLKYLRRYITKHQLQLQAHLTAPQYACVVALLNAIVECIAILPTNTPNP